MRTFALSTLVFFSIGCSNPIADQSQINKVNTDSTTSESVSFPKDSLAKLYTQAISEFIKAANLKNKTAFDTLFFGKHVYGQPDDFPDIQLPQTIENTQVRLITPDVGKIQQKRKSSVYINMMGWVDEAKAQFKFIVFSNGFEHQYDYTIDFTYSSVQKGFVLEKIEFENYLPTK